MQHSWVQPSQSKNFTLSLSLNLCFYYILRLYNYHILYTHIHMYNRPVARSGFGGLLFHWKCTFSLAFWKKVVFFVLILGKSGPFRAFFFRMWTFSLVHHMSGACILHFKFWPTKYVQNCGPFWALWTKIMDHFGHFWTMGGCFRTPRTPWLWACITQEIFGVQELQVIFWKL